MPLEIHKLTVEYLENLITESPKEMFTKVEILVLLNLVKNDPAIVALLGQSATSRVWD
jgi:hypothetical protein